MNVFLTARYFLKRYEGDWTVIGCTSIYLQLNVVNDLLTQACYVPPLSTALLTS